MRVKRIMAVLLTTLMLFGSVFTNVSIASQSSTDPNDIISTLAPPVLFSAAPTPATRIPTITPDTKPDSKGEVYLTVDKTFAAVGDVITATLNIRYFEAVAGYQANIKFDPTVLVPIYADGTPYDRKSFPEYGTLLQKRYNAIDLAANDLTKGILSFGREYMSMDIYRNSGVAENTGSIAVIKFKVLKNTPTQIKFEDSPILTNAVNGTMMFDWYGKQLSNYIVTQAPEINSTIVTPTPPNKAEVYMTVDKTNAAVEDIITATLNVKGFIGIVGYQACVKYDPAVLMPVDENGVPYDNTTLPGYGTIFKKGSKLSELASNDLVKGLLNFGRCYFPMNTLVASDYGSTGSIAVIRFKVLKNASTAITLVNVPSLTNPIDGTMIFDWDGAQLSNYKVSQAPSINSSNPLCKGELYVSVDKTTATVGDIITATLNVKGFDSIAGYQVCMKYDRSVLVPVYEDGVRYEKDSVPEYGTLMQKKFSPVDSAFNDFENGCLNFSRVYMNIEKYRNSGVPDQEGSLAVVRFKVIRAASTKISLVDSPALTNAVDGTMVFDWNAAQLSNYKVTQAPEISSTVVTPTPPYKAEVYMTVDKTTADAGDIIKATLNIKGFSDGISGYQANIKYDPTVLMPIYSDGSLYDEKAPAEYGTLLQYRFGPIDVASNDLVNGTLTFGRGYMNMPEYRNSGIIESEGSLAVIRFKVLKAAPVSITMENGPACLDAISGTMIFGRNNLRNNDYTVTQAPAINSHLIKPTPTPDVGMKDAGVYLLLDKTNVSVGDIIKATIYADGFEIIAGYQATVKYDPSVLQPVYPDGSSYDGYSVPEYGTLLQKRFSPVDMALNNVSKGILTFGRSYMDMASYRKSGVPENKGSLAVIQFKVLKSAYTNIALENALGFPNTESGTMMFDWNSTQLKGYKVINQPIIAIQTPSIPTPTITVKPTPTMGSGEVYVTLDKTNQSVGDVITASINLKGFKTIAGFEANIKYDPSALMPVYGDGTPYDSASMPESGTLFNNKKYMPSDAADNDLSKGTLTFGKSYMDISTYRKSGNAENDGTVAIVRFKVLKSSPTAIKLEDAAAMTNSISGTMVFDWDAKQLSGYKVTQAPLINNYFTPTTPKTTPTPTAKLSKGEVYMTLDKNNAAVGDIITATVGVKDIACLAAYQVNIKYNPSAFQPVYEDGTPYDNKSVPEYGTLLQKRFSPTDIVNNDLKNGILNFGRAYMSMSQYKNSGTAETTGSLAVIRFKVLKADKPVIVFEDSSTMSNQVTGTMVFDWDGNQLTGYKVSQPQSINIGTATPTPTPTYIPKKGTIYLTLDKSNAVVGDIVKATVNVKDFDCIAAYQANIKYDPTMLQPVYFDGTVYDETSVPEYGNLLQKRYSPIDMAVNDLNKGILNFGRSYMALSLYKNSGVPEREGKLAIVGFKVLKAGKTNILLDNTSFMQNAISGTMVFDWDGYQLSGYKVLQAPALNILGPVVTPTPKACKGSISLQLDRSYAAVGDIIKATIDVKDFDCVAGYQASVKYDPTVLQPVYSDGTPYDNSSVPEYGNLLQKSYSPTDMGANDLKKGILSFGRTYMNLDAYKKSGVPEQNGTLAVICFKVLKASPANVIFYKSPSMPNAVEGTMIFDWDGYQILGYRVIQSMAVIPDGSVKMTFDKEKVKVGDMVKATVSIDGINKLTGFQFNIKYDKNYLQPWDTQSDSPYKTATIPDLSTILTNEKYIPLSIAANDIASGILNFGKTYLDISSYKGDETSNQSVVITFKVINKIPEGGAKLAWFEHSDTMGNDVNGTLVFAADSKPLTSDNYKVISPASIYPEAEQSFVIGDVDCSGSVNSDDYAYIRQYLLGMIENFPCVVNGLKAADVDGDGNIDSDDYAYMRRWLVGMIDKFPAEEK
ncbi:cohesin domain-containing protein [Pseudobacteroides cellulosolvens]|uniref:Cellulosome anchoring protein cohesin region n=1 Tax=Pseudobacteroides cellulosolvens ATCC 35603 = DSM 2933 TaxID=398512 RepID=A0A0L6JJS3_9FIRM|nr:cohesin domain-containing protein [Pseudobacteroides cellulosolvens]KNY26131.1 cellulosome anchoring protein cohesin region [Pseudobacteroides cellulosolvens ATCC 35603 = DSM 2933]